MEQLANNARSNLTTSITNVASSLAVNSATSFPTAGNFMIKVDSELMIVTSTVGTSFNVTRGADGTTAASHSSGAEVTHVVSKKVLENLYAEAYQIGTVASRPTTVRGGTIYYGTDLDVEWLYNGTNWDLIWPAYAPYANRVDISSWTSLNLGTTTWTDNNGVLSVTVPDVNSQLKGYYKALPTAPYTCNTVVGLGGSSSSSVEAGFMLYDSGTGKLKTLGSTAGGLVHAITNVTGVAGTYSALSSFQMAPFQVIYLRFNDDNTNWNYSWSPDGSTWTQFYKETRNTTMTPTNVGIYVRTTSGIGLGTLYRNFYGYWET
jgi:hypothetical protein